MGGVTMSTEGLTIFKLIKHQKNIKLKENLSEIFRDDLRILAKREGINPRDITDIGVKKAVVKYSKGKGFGVSGTIYIDTKERRHKGASQTMFFIYWPVAFQSQFEKEYGEPHKDARIAKKSGKIKVSGKSIAAAKLNVSLLIKTNATKRSATFRRTNFDEVRIIAKDLMKKKKYDEIHYDIKRKGRFKRKGG